MEYLRRSIWVKENKSNGLWEVFVQEQQAFTYSVFPNGLLIFWNPSLLRQCGFNEPMAINVTQMWLIRAPELLRLHQLLHR